MSLFTHRRGGASVQRRSWSPGRLLIVAMAAGLPLTAVVAAARAAPAAVPPTLIVNSAADAVAAGPLDDGTCATVYPYAAPLTCTVRAAIMKANHWPGGGARITFNSSLNGLPIALTIHPNGNDDETSGDLNISQTTWLVGNGAGLTLLDAQLALDRAFRIEPGAVVSLYGLTIQNGRAGLGGGGVYVDAGAALTLDHSAVISNTDTSGFGGGGLLNSGALTLTASLVGYNASTSGSGGGVTNAPGGHATILSSTLISNAAGLNGGGILNTGSSFNLFQSTVISNTAAQYGGGLDTDAAGGLASVLNSTLSDNRAGALGGGLAADGGQTNVTNSALSDNHTSASGGGLAASFGGQANVINSTLSNNTAVGYGGGVEATGGGSAVSLYNATVANNQADLNFTGAGKGGGLSTASGGAISLQNSLIADNYASVFLSGSTWIGFRDDCFGAPTSVGYNLLTFLAAPDIHTCNLAPTVGDLVTTTDHLGALQANGGPTFTHALLPGSPAIDAGDPGGCSGPAAVPLATDQRGDPRVANGAGLTRCDIGAYEVQNVLALPLVRR